MSSRGHIVQGVVTFFVAPDVQRPRAGKKISHSAASGAFITPISLHELVWNAACYWSWYVEHEVKLEDAVVNQLFNFSSMQYAVIEALHSEAGPERFVIAYPNEQSLRDVIAEPSIVAFGFSSREEAIAGGRACVMSAVAHQRIPETVAGRKTATHQRVLTWAELREETGSLLRKLGGFFVTACSNAVTTATLIFSSNNTVSTAIRITLGSSV
jgi:hypothetical protein